MDTPQARKRRAPRKPVEDEDRRQYLTEREVEQLCHLPVLYQLYARAGDTVPWRTMTVGQAIPAANCSRVIWGEDWAR
jgi:hypothetical protein